MDKKLTEMTLEEILKETSSDSPAPGGGAIAGLTGSLAAALGQMVLALSYGKKAFEALDTDVQEQMKKHDSELGELQCRLFGIMQEDSEAFLGYMDALKMPKRSHEEQEDRLDAMQRAAQHSLAVPLECAERCLSVLELLPLIADNGNKNAITDVGVSSLLACAACESALMNVRINIPSIKNEEIRSKAEKRSEEILDAAKELNDQILDVVYSKI